MARVEKKRKHSVRRPARRLLPIIVATMLFASVLCAAAFGWLVLVYAQQPGPGPGGVVAIEIANDTSPEALAHQLAAKGALARSRLFALYVRAMSAHKRLRTGRVLLRDDMSPRALLQRVAEGFGSAEVRVTLVEGATRFDMARQLWRWGLCRPEDFLEQTENARLLNELEIDAPNAEGYLFPDTYRLHDGLGAEVLVRRLVGNFRRRMQRLLNELPQGLPRLKRDLGWGLHEVLILASIVEKEAALRSERPVIAGVFINRLRRPDFRPRRLQADPTVAYGCLVTPSVAPSCAGFDGRRVTRSMIEDEANAYNTYRHPGLPPGPIANPGLDAIRAVLSPQNHDYLYFVVSGGGAHRFSATLEEHNAAVQSYRGGGAR